MKTPKKKKRRAQTTTTRWAPKSVLNIFVVAGLPQRDGFWWGEVCSWEGCGKFSNRSSKRNDALSLQITAIDTTNLYCTLLQENLTINTSFANTYVWRLWCADATIMKKCPFHWFLKPPVAQSMNNWIANLFRFSPSPIQFSSSKLHYSRIQSMKCR